MLSIVIPSYNRCECMLNLLNDLYQQQDVDMEVIVVDDCSTDETVESIKQRFPQVRLFVNEKNGGPSVSRNRGIKEANGDIVVGFDSDVTVPDIQVLKKVEQTFNDHPDVDGLAFRIYMPDEETDDVDRWWHPKSSESHANKAFHTSYFSGTAYAFRTEKVREAGCFPEVFFIYYEEVELAFRILDNGGKILYNPRLTVVHHVNQVSHRNDYNLFYKPRNQILITIRCYPLFKGLVYLLPRLVYGAARSISWFRFGRYLQALNSARKLAPDCIVERNPLKKATWKQITSLPNQPEI